MGHRPLAATCVRVLRLEFDIPPPSAPRCVNAPLRITLFGTLDIQGPEPATRLAAQPKSMSVLVYLLLATPRGFQRRDRLAGLFWPDQPDARARASLRNVLYGIREALGPDLVETRGDEEVRVPEGAVDCDALAFERAIAQGELARALELYRGELLQSTFYGEPGLEQWIEERRAAYRTAAADAAWTLAQRYETATDLTAATRWARKAARLAGADERRIRRVMKLMAEAGDRAGAIQVYDEFVRYLERELQVRPSAESERLAADLREGRAPA